MLLSLFVEIAVFRPDSVKAGFNYTVVLHKDHFKMECVKINQSQWKLVLSGHYCFLAGIEEG